MHEWHSDNSTNIVQLIDSFMDYEFTNDWGQTKVTRVRIDSKLCKDSTEARDYCTRCSYGTQTAVLCAYTPNKLTKAYQSAFANFCAKRNDYEEFKRVLNIGYGRKSSKVTCPQCKSSINLAYGSGHKSCPICGSTKIISDSNWKSLETKKNLMRKAGEALQKEASKAGVSFMCAIEWHC